MNYNVMTSRELIHYLDLYNTDPVVQRLVKLLQEESVVQELVDVGMDPVTRTFKDDWERCTPGEYIEELRHQVRSLEDECDDLKKHKEELEDECDRLKSRSVLEFLQEVEREKRENQSLVREAMKTVKAYKDENDNLKQKIDMWGKLNKVY